MERVSSLKYFGDPWIKQNNDNMNVISTDLATMTSILLIQGGDEKFLA